MTYINSDSQNPGNPLVGTDISLFVPVDPGMILLRTFAFQLTTSAAVANRIVRFFIVNGSKQLWLSENAIAQTASLTVQYCFALGISMNPVLHTTGLLSRTFPLPEIKMLGNWQFGTDTIALDAGDQFSAINFTSDMGNA